MHGFFNRFRNKASRRQDAAFAPLAPAEDFVAVGDIHGCYDLLGRLLDRIAVRPDCGRLVFLGDYIDRGESSAQVLQALHGMQAGDPEVVCLRGNHEDMLLGFLDDPLGEGPGWLRHGGRQTLASFGIEAVHAGMPELNWIAARESLQNRLGAGLISWIRALPAYWQSGNLTAVHAGADPARPMEAQEDYDLVWGHSNFGRVPRQDGVWIVHGHTIVEDVRTQGGRICVDTGAFATGKLSAVAVRNDGFEVLTA
ncbi:metallophosphoesterase family protein [Leisingera sp. F5]|uniref:metallophosphoesterase family protein n=1 Tax=Leisingera sp. F5 TaxID=1813816 RepID=UPI000A75AA9C|nr:metallophosphoesterase family protein [Leisingera sp. F5]